MNKEELIIGFFENGCCCYLDEVKNTCLGLLKENQELKKQLEVLEQENKKQKEVIDKTIECLTMFPDRWTSDEKKEVLQILKRWNK